MAYKDFLKELNDNSKYYQSYRAIGVKGIKILTKEIAKHARREDDINLIQNNNYSFILQEFKVFINQKVGKLIWRE